jgi:AraC-like DNA-binding protein
MSSSPLTQVSNHRRILHENGSWWLVDPYTHEKIHLNSRFSPCNWNIGRLCKSLGLGKRTFTRLVEDCLGITAKRWLREIRINVAFHLLREEGKIESVARTLGFKHASNFAHEFQKITGVSPSHYVKAEYSRSLGYLPML